MCLKNINLNRKKIKDDNGVLYCTLKNSTLCKNLLFVGKVTRTSIIVVDRVMTKMVIFIDNWSLKIFIKQNFLHLGLISKGGELVKEKNAR